MKTNVNMVRKLDTFDVVQRTKDGMFNATVLLQQWNEKSGQKKMIAHYFENKSVEEFINTIIQKENLSYRDSVMIKSRANKGVNAGTWMHPLLFIDFAMWINPAFKYDVLRFVYDNLIAFRHDCGDNYRSLTASVSKFPDVDYPRLARALNYVVFGKHYGNIRNDASEAQLQELRSLEEKLSYAVDNDFITNFEELIKALRRNWADKWSKF